MGIELNYYRIREKELEKFNKDEKYAMKFLYGQNGKEFNGNKHLCHIKRLEEKGKFYSVGKDWQAIHFLLTNEFAFPGKSNISPPLSNLVMGGHLTQIEETYGNVKYLLPDEIKLISQYLENITLDELKEKYNFRAFNAVEVYPARTFWSESDIDSLLTLYDGLALFFENASSSGDSILLLFV